MIDQQLPQLQSTLGNAKSISILLGNNPSLDQAAAALSLYLSLSSAGKSVSINASDVPTVQLGNLVGVNKIKKAQTGDFGQGFVIALPYKDGVIDKISCDVDDARGKMLLTVVPGPLGIDFTPSDIAFEVQNGKADVIVAVGIHTEQMVSELSKDTQGATIVNIDNSLRNAGYGSLVIVDGAYSSVSEIVTTILKKLELPLDVDIAQNLLSGIVDRTRNFQDENTSPFAFELSGYLLQKGARRSTYTRQQHTNPRPGGNDLSQLERANRDHNQDRNRRHDQRQPRQEGYVPQQTQPQPVQQAQPQPVQPIQEPVTEEVQPQIQQSRDSQQKAPKDWFEPKIYKGSSSVS